MFETVTVDQAISRGRRIIILPSFFIIAIGIFVTIYLCADDPEPGIDLFAGIALSPVLAWLYWSVVITRWRLWAFENVRNVHELQRKAVEAKLIWRDGSFFEKTEIRTAAQKQKWQVLHTKFNTKDVYQQDYLLPDEMAIKYSRGKVVVYLLVGLLLVIAAGFAVLAKEYWVAATIGGLGIFLGFSQVRKLINDAPQVILNAKGIQSEKYGFIEWSDVRNERVVRRQQGKSSVIYLEYDDPNNKTAQINIVELDVSKNKLEDMLHTYRIRSEKAKILQK